MREFEFECRLCAHLESTESVVARQLGAGVGSAAGGRVMDVINVTAGPAMDARRALTPDTIPKSALRASLSVAEWRPVTRVFEGSPERARKRARRAGDAGFVERTRRHGQDMVRQTVPYPEEWFDSLIGIENKPDLGRPGRLARQLRTDVSLGVFDRVVLATESYVTGAHRHRIPDPVGIWRVDFDAPSPIEVIREASGLAVGAPGIQIRDRRSDRVVIDTVTADAKASARRRIAERAYGSGWRPDPPGCEHIGLEDVDGTASLPYCSWYERVVDPARSCGRRCDGFKPASPPDTDQRSERDQRTAWTDRGRRCRRQSRLDRF